MMNYTLFWNFTVFLVEKKKNGTISLPKKNLPDSGKHFFDVAKSGALILQNVGDELVVSPFYPFLQLFVKQKCTIIDSSQYSYLFCEIVAGEKDPDKRKGPCFERAVCIELSLGNTKFFKKIMGSVQVLFPRVEVQITRFSGSSIKFFTQDQELVTTNINLAKESCYPKLGDIVMKDVIKIGNNTFTIAIELKNSNDDDYIAKGAHDFFSRHYENEPSNMNTIFIFISKKKFEVTMSKSLKMKNWDYASSKHNKVFTNNGKMMGFIVINGLEERDSDLNLDLLSKPDQSLEFEQFKEIFFRDPKVKVQFFGSEEPVYKKQKTEKEPKKIGKILYVKIGKDGKEIDICLKEETFAELKKMIQDEYKENEKIKKGEFNVLDKDEKPVSKDGSVKRLEDKSTIQIVLKK